jgi:hypothetical protein
MPFVYVMPTAILANNFTTSATPNTEIDHQFIKPGTRNVSLISVLAGGKGAGLSVLTGIAYRIKKWQTTAAAGGTAMTPNPLDVGAQASKATAGWTAAASVTAGTGGPQFLGSMVSGGSSSVGWVAENADAAPTMEGSANQSLDLWSISGTASMNFEATTKFQE